MRNKKIYTIIVISSLVLLCSQQNQVIQNTNGLIQNSNQPVLNADLKIVIDGDLDLALYPGYGNETHPYVIQGFSIDVPNTGDIGIHVGNTTKHFEIKNNDLTSITVGYVGILIQNVAPNTAKILNNEIIHYARYETWSNLPEAV